MSESPADVKIQPITDDLREACWQLRLRALHDHPDAFGQLFESASRLTPLEIRATQDDFWTGGDNQVFIAIDQFGTLGGMIGVARERKAKERHRMAIWGVYVAPEFRGLGLSSRLLDTAIDHARGVDGILQVHLAVISSNLAAVRAYERTGFVRWGTMPRTEIVNGNVLDLDFMVYMLDGLIWSSRIQSEGTIA